MALHGSRERPACGVFANSGGVGGAGKVHLGSRSLPGETFPRDHRREVDEDLGRSRGHTAVKLPPSARYRNVFRDCEVFKVTQHFDVEIAELMLRRRISRFST